MAETQQLLSKSKGTAYQSIRPLNCTDQQISHSLTAFSQWPKAIEKEIQVYSATKNLKTKTGVARDHLANERTYLAWLRTSLSTISCGIAITQLFRLNAVSNSSGLVEYGRPVGMAFIGMSMVFLMFGCLRYFHVQTTLTRDYFPSSNTIVFLTTLIVVSAATCLFFIIVSSL
ncbi:hypothetical protein BDF14DRAFT_1772197 [Spinellus fusiger]|nr:hypothetical protein BDF14DRAFT_1772197 [Spinellus fusiger]